MNWKVLSQLFLTVVLGLLLLDLALEDNSSRIAIGSKVKLSRKELAEAVVLATTLNAPEIERSKACKALSDFGASLGKARQNLIRSIQLEPFTEESREFLADSEEQGILVARFVVDRSGAIGELKYLIFPVLSGAVEALDGSCPLHDPSIIP